MNNRTGISFSYRSKFYKLITVEWGNDNSFYFLPAQHDAEVGERITTEAGENGRLLLNVDTVQGGNFPMRKISRHTSGYFHIKDVTQGGGKREKDGLKGLPFSSVNGYYTFLVACPQRIDTLVEVAQADALDIVVNLPDDIEPFAVQFAVWEKKRGDRVPLDSSKFLGGGFITLAIDNMEYGLIFFLTAVVYESPDIPRRFPARTVFLHQIGK